MNKTAKTLTSGDILTTAGRTKHSPVTITEVQDWGNAIRVVGFNGHNSEPRVMFRALNKNLPVIVN